MNIQKIKTRLLLSAAALAVSFIVASRADAAAVIINEDPTVTTVVTDLTGFQTTGSDMAGKLDVTAFFVGGGSETVPWVATGPGAGSATGASFNWSLIESGDTFNSLGPTGRWELDVKNPNTL